jgi:hypothetical protein
MTQMQMIAAQANQMVEIEQNQLLLSTQLISQDKRLDDMEEAVKNKITILPSRPQGLVTKSELRRGDNGNVCYGETFTRKAIIDILEKLKRNGDLEIIRYTNPHLRAEGQHVEAFRLAEVNRIIKNLNKGL